MHKHIIRILLFILFFTTCFLDAYSQCDTCDHTLTFYVDLSSTPDSVWISPDTYRQGECCGNTGMNCIRFIVTTNPNSDQLSFNIATPPIPPGQFYQYDCGPYVSAGEPLCITGTGPHCIVYCKPGADMSQYSITVSQTIHASPSITVSDGCTGVIWATGIQESSMVWNSVYPGTYGQYNGYLDCAVGCDTTGVTAQPGYPPYIDFEVSGTLEAPCDTFQGKDTVRVYFVDTSGVNIQPDTAFICFGDAYATVTANPYGGAPPYTYLWSTGETTQSINVGVGTYWVAVSDTTVCPPSYDTVIVIQHPAPITANAGPDQLLCIDNPNVNLNGNVTVATGGYWSGGSGTFIPDSTALNATYIPTPAEIAAGSLTLYFTTTGNDGCPPVTDLLTITWVPQPVVDAGPDQTVCANNSMVSLSGSISGGASTGIWTSSGSGTFSPSDTALGAVYQPSNADTANGSVTIYLTSTDGCVNLTDSMIITIYPAPYVDAGPDQLICENDFDVDLSGYVGGGASTGIWTTLGSGTFSPSATNLNATYNISPGDTAAGSVVLILTSTNNGNCNPVADTMVINILNVPIVDAGPDLIICNYDAVPLNGTITGGSGTGIWTTPNGTGVFDPDHTDLNATYYPGINDYVNGTITLILTSTNNGTCLPSFDDLIINVQPTPIVFAGPNQIVCANNADVVLNGSITNGASEGIWTSSGTGIFVPNDTALNATYIPSDTDTANGSVVLTLTATNGCDSISDDMNVIITPAPVVDAGPDIYICFGDTLVPLSGSVSAGSSTGQWSTLGTGYFLPSADDLNATYIMSAADTAAGGVTLVLESTNNGNCLPVSDSLQVFITETSTVNAGPYQTICGNMTATLNGTVQNAASSGIWTTPDGTGYFYPSDTSLNAEYYPSAADTAAGSVTIVLTAQYACNPASDTLIVTILPAPGADAGVDQIVCLDNPDVSLNGWVTSWAAPGLWQTTGTGTFSPGTGVLNATYSPSAADIAAGSVQLILTTTNNGMCDPAYDTMTVTILPPPIADAGQDQTICANNTAVLNGQIIGGSGQGVWTTMGTGTFSPSDSLLSTTYIPSAADTVNGAVYLVLTSINNGNCNPVTDTMLIDFSPAPIVDAGPDQTVCANNADVSLSGSVTYATGGEWSSLGGGTFFPSNTDLNAIYTPSITEINNGFAILVLSSTGNGLCLPETDTMIVTITPAPVVNAGPDKYICEGTVSVTLSGTVSGITTTGQWSTLGSGTFFPSPQSLITTYNLSSGDIANDSVALVLTSTNNQYCNPVTDTVWIFITAIPTTNAGPDQIVCANNSQVLLNGVVTGTTGTGVWSALNGSGTFTPSNTNLTTTYIPGASDISQGSVTILLTATNACIPVTDTMIVTITPAPVVDAGPDQLVCENATSVSLNGTVTGGSTTGIWTTSGTGSFSPSNTNLSADYIPSSADTVGGGIYVILTSTNNGDCYADSDTMYISFGVKPNANFTYPDTICLYDNVSFINTSTISSGSIVMHEWDFGGTNVFTTQDASLSFTSPGIYDVQLVETSNIGCNDTIIQQVTVNPLPVVDFNYSSQCTNDSIWFTDNSSPVVSWLWMLGNGNVSTDQNPDAQVYSLPGQYNISLTVVDALGCENTAQSPLIIYATPEANAIAQDLCLGEITQFTDLSTVVNDTITSWSWDFDDGNTSTLQNPTNTYTTSGSYQVIFTVSTDHCSDTDTLDVDIAPTPIIDVIPSATEVCNLTTIMFTNNTTNAVNYYWDFGDGTNSVLESPSHTFINNSFVDHTYLVELIAYSSNGCADTLYQNIIVHPSPLATFVNDAIPRCSPLEVNFTNYSTGAVSYLWDFGDGTTSTAQDPVHIFYNDTSFILYYQVQLNAISQYGCQDSAVDYITVFPNTDFEFVLDPDSSCHPDIVEIIAVPGAFSYYWDYGDGVTETAGPNTWHEFTNTGSVDSIYQVELITTSYYSCVDTTIHNIVVHPTPNTAFTIDTVSGCTPLYVNINNTTTGAVHYTWSFGDGDSLETTSTNQISHTYTNYNALPISYNLTLVAENIYGCQDYYTQVVNVYPGALAEFTATDSIGCSPLEIDFNNNSLGADHYYWDFGDGNSSTNTNPHNTFVNTGMVDSIYTVSLIAVSPYNCIDTAYFDITVHPKPEALFGLPNSAGCAPFVANLTNSSIGASSYMWTFGDGDTSYSSASSISHLYENNFALPVNYTLILTAENNFSCIDTVMQTITVFPVVTAAFTSDTAGCTPFSVIYNNQSVGAASFFWSFGDGNTSTDINPLHVFTNLSDSVQNLTTQLITYSTYSCVDTVEHNITVYPKPNAVFTLDSVVSCSPFNAEIHNSTSNATSYFWDFGDGTTSTTTDTVFNHEFTNYQSTSQIFTINLHAENIYGCSDDDSKYVTLFPNLTPLFTCDTIGCSPLQVHFFDFSLGAENYYWDFGDGATSSEVNPVHTLTNYSLDDTIYTVTLTITSADGCVNSTTQEILVYATPFADFYPTPTYQVYPSTGVDIHNNTQGPWTYLWDFGDSTTSTAAHPPQHVYDTWGEYTIFMTAYSPHCQDTLSQTVIIDPPPPKASFSPSAEGCTPLTVNFINHSEYALTYYWSFGDGGVSTEENPTYTYYNAGTYAVTLKVTGYNNQHDITTGSQIIVHQTPTAFFQYTPSYVNIPNEGVHTFNLSDGADYYSWDFGDGTAADTATNPVHYYTEEGTYDITLWAWTDEGCRDSILIPAAVVAEADCKMIFPNAFTPNDAGQGSGYYTLNDKFTNDIFFPTYQGITEYRLEIFNRWGELIFVSEDIQKGWDGYYRGKPCKQDVYIWKAEWKCVDGTNYSKIGDVLLLR